jgi:hypothetical protein
MRIALATALSAILLTGLPGCKKGEPDKTGKDGDERLKADALKRIALTAETFHDEHKRYPRSQEEFEKELGAMEYGAQVRQDLNSGKYVLVYGGLTRREIGNSPATSSGTVLAYDADVPTQGGLVITCALEVKRATAEQFKKMPQAKK